MKLAIKTLYQRWKIAAQKIATVQVKAVFAVAYIIFVVPFGLCLKLFLRFPRPGWHAVKVEKNALSDAKRQF